MYATTEYKSLEEEESRSYKNFGLLKSTNWGSVSLTQGEPSDKHTKTLQWAPPTPQYRKENIYFQHASQAKTKITKFKGDYSVKKILTPNEASLIPTKRDEI